MSTNDKPLVSVLMTTYNREKYLAIAVESVLASTYENFELIIVDDQSKDKSYEIALSYAQKDKRVKVFKNEKNLGDYPNRNKAASLASGKYLKYVDADDMIYPTGLEVMVSGMEKFPEAGYGLSTMPADKMRPYPFMLKCEEAYKYHYFESLLFHRAPLSAIIKKDVFESVGGFTGKRYLGDFEMWHVLSARYPVVLMAQGVIWYREHEEQEMQNNRTDFTIPFKYVKCAEEMLLKPECPLNANDKERALRKVRWNQARYILGIGKNHSLKTMQILKNESGMSYTEIFKRVIFKPKEW
ncbi:MAG: glycosyltransferase family 2 protein [Lentimicrobiaceae bacterium]|nr:glycosyltransferase family 2 protein [Lentimicrobiaceae bacterium]MCB9023393.1 glycosyltransferase family 2 protein [Lentimicrobiaceae bacterium]